MRPVVKRIDTLKVSLENKPGQLTRILSAFRDAGIDVSASWNYTLNGSKAEAVLYPNDIRKAHEILTRLGNRAIQSQACYVEAENKPSTYYEILSRVEKAGLQICSCEAMGMNGKFASIFFADEKDFPRLVKALGSD